MPLNKAHAPLLAKSFPTLLRTQLGDVLYNLGGFIVTNKQNKQNK